MTASVSKDKPHGPLHTVKVRASTATRPSATGANNSTRSQTAKGSPDKMPIEDMVNKGLDLAEVGIGLGVNIVARLGSILKDQFLDKLNGADMLSSVVNTMAASQQQPSAQNRPDQTSATNEAQQSAEQNYYLFNRLPLHPGGKFSLSFSVNNDSPTSEKAIKLTLEPFVGETHGQRIAAEQIAITPSETSIAVVDFEKFVLSGNLATNLPADTYQGWVIVSTDQTYRIPVVLSVSAAQTMSDAESQSETNQS